MATRADARAQAGIPPPEPDLTPQEIIDQAIALPREWAFGEIAREHLGLPRRDAGNVQTPHGPK
jgi:hypothetical protein